MQFCDASKKEKESLVPRTRCRPCIIARMALTFCAPPDQSARLGVLGIFSHHTNLRYREHIRHTWLRDASQRGPTLGVVDSVMTKFVLRGMGVSSSAVNESASHGDILFVRGAADAGRKAGPLQSLIMWYECALRAWPHTELIGKGDDDIWADIRAAASVSR